MTRSLASSRGAPSPIHTVRQTHYDDGTYVVRVYRRDGEIASERTFLTEERATEHFTFWRELIADTSR